MALRINFKDETPTLREKQTKFIGLRNNKIIISFKSSMGLSPSTIPNEIGKYPLCSHFQLKIQDLQEVNWDDICWNNSGMIGGLELIEPIDSNSVSWLILEKLFKNNCKIFKKLIFALKII